MKSVIHRFINGKVLVAAGLIAILAGQSAYAQTGACCVTGGGAIQCFEVTQAECDSFGGVFHGAGTQCAPFLCSNSQPIGACCSANGSSCFTSTQANCENSGHTFLGVGTDCNPYPCDLPPTGACCLEDVLFCFDTDAVQCDNFDGVFHEGKTCADLDCGGGKKEELGACCIISPNGGISCTVVSEASCTSGGGEFQGVNTDCDPFPCDPGTGPIGACCLVGGGAIQCSVLHESHCIELSGEFQGKGTSCTPNPCLPGDSNNDNAVNIDDLFTVVANWGPCPDCDADFDYDHEVDIDDLFTVVMNWTQ